MNIVPVSKRGYRKYSKEVLLDYLKKFYKINKRTPMSSDFDRKLLPGRKFYNKNFGNLNAARHMAGVPVVIQFGYGKYKQVKI